MSNRDYSYRYLLQWLIGCTRGGANRGRIIEALKEEPMNANQLGNLLGVDYRTIRHHLDVLEKNKLINSIGERYGKMYFISLELEKNYAVFEEIWVEIGKRLKKEGKK